MKWGTLVGVDELAGALGNEALRIVDARSALMDPLAGGKAYQESHLPGAIHADLNRDLSDLTHIGEGRHPLPEAAAFTRKLGDGTMVEMEVLFMSLDRPADVKKLKSLDLTGVWLNEASELAKAVLDMATGRVGRFPSKVQGGATWSGVILDTNSPDDDHWYYELAEKPTSEELAQRDDLVRQLVEMGLMRPGQLLYEWFAQPGALIKQRRVPGRNHPVTLRSVVRAESRPRMRKPPSQ